MSAVNPGGCAGGAIRSEGGDATARGAADWLYLAAAPTFAAMALLTAVLGGGQPDILCSADEHGSPLTGMIPMYLLMSAFHLPPWLKLISSRRTRGPRGARHGCDQHRNTAALVTPTIRLPAPAYLTTHER